MKASELRIGNRVTINNQVTKEILTDLELYAIHIDDFDNQKILLKPIPLTEFWLEKFGTTDQGLLVQPSDYPDGDLYIDFDDNGKCFLQNCSEGYNFGKEIKYVHQLQNLYFALTGEELILKESL